MTAHGCVCAASLMLGCNGCCGLGLMVRVVFTTTGALAVATTGATTKPVCLHGAAAMACIGLEAAEQAERGRLMLRGPVVTTTGLDPDDPDPSAPEGLTGLLPGADTGTAGEPASVGFSG
mmetsp:Transcript_15175/g.26554  ORF Transcript_15175/g.26554 Transcript_15175/m.26554 type:complete len:120 (+) Transcript_15175:3114-3473(+)